MLLRLKTAPLGARKRDDITRAEDLFLPLDAKVCFVPGNERAGHLTGVLALSSRSNTVGILFDVGVDRPPKYLLFGGGRRGYGEHIILGNRQEGRFREVAMRATVVHGVVHIGKKSAY